MGKHVGTRDETVILNTDLQVLRDVKLIDDSIEKHPIPEPTVTEDNPSGKKVKK